MRRLVLVCGMASLLDSAAIISVGSALPLWRAGFGLDDWGVGFVSFALTLSIAVGALVGGPVSDRVGRVPVFTSTVVGYAVAAGLVALADRPAALYAGVVLLGLSSGADLPASLSMVSERAPAASRARLVALTHVLWTVGIVAATGAALVVSPFGLTGMRVVFGILGVAALLTVAARRRAARTPEPAGPPGPPGSPDAPPARPVPTTRTDRSLRPALLVGAFYVVYTLVANTFGSFRTYFLVVVGGASQSAATAIAFAVTLLGLAGTVVFSAVADTAWRRRAYVPGAVLLVGSQVLIAATGGEGLGLVVVALVLYSLAYPFVGESLYKVWSQELVAADLRGTVQGVTIAAARATAAGFAVVTPTLMSWSPHGLFALLALCALASSAVGFRITRRGAAPPTRDASGIA